MYGLLITVHILICVGLIVAVLLQSGKGGGLAGGAFGGTAQTVFGGRGATDFMTRATMVLGGAFFLTSLVLALMTSNPGQGARSLIQEQARRAPAPAGQLPGSAPGQAPAQQSPGGATPAPPAGGAAPATPPSSGGGK
jgi:preprotein translocase subunit SecG